MTIYTDVKNCLWRLKPDTGSRKLVHYSWKKVEPKAAWAELVGDVRKAARG